MAREKWYNTDMFDLTIITAANAAQAKGYRAQLLGREGIIVIPDPGDKRVGSLGATVNALRIVKNKYLDKKSILIIHSGGDAKRTVGYAAMGKAFIPLGDGRSIFEHIKEAMERLKLPKGGGVVVASGDVLPRLDYGNIDLSKPGVTGVAYPDGPEEAARHGVYIVGKAKNEKLAKVENFLQKPKLEGTSLIDTGIMFIDSPTAAKMISLPIAGDIYEEFPKLLLNKFAPFHVNIVQDCDFFHIGSTREIVEKLGDAKSRTYIDCVHAELDMAGDNVATNIPPGRFKKIKLAKGECITCIPYGKNKWLDLKYRIDDNFKTDGLWEKYNLGQIIKNVDYKRLLKIRRTKICRATAPVRIDLAGGWSDTPPICNMVGGKVLNVAVKLDGEKPIEVTVAERADKNVKIVSKDLGKRRVIKSQKEIDEHSDPHDWCALVKCALSVTGFRFGSRGLDITICANLPKGSGMGTSSILGACTIAVLLGRANADELGEKTLQLEKEMRTGGGWQDQFGGVLPGVKMLRSKPGDVQVIEHEELESKWLSSLLKSRGLLYFTGQKRMARNILRKVLAFWHDNPHDFANILVKSLKTDAEKGAKAIKERDEAGLIDAINGYWRDKKLLDPGSTNERVEEIIDNISKLISAVTLTGAGGGGFMFILASSNANAKKIRALLEREKPSKYSRFYDFEIDSEGIKLEMK